jgi:hypothetical protein
MKRRKKGAINMKAYVSRSPTFLPSSASPTRGLTNVDNKINLLKKKHGSSSLKSTLKEWVRAHVERDPYNLKVRNLSSCFRDGLVFGALVHSLIHQKYNCYDWFSFCKKEEVENEGDEEIIMKERLQQVFNTAEHVLHLNQLLDPIDVVEYYDEKSIILYLLNIKNSVNNALPIEELVFRNRVGSGSGSGSGYRVRVGVGVGVGVGVRVGFEAELQHPK